MWSTSAAYKAAVHFLGPWYVHKAAVHFLGPWYVHKAAVHFLGPWYVYKAAVHFLGPWYVHKAAVHFLGPWYVYKAAVHFLGPWYVYKVAVHFLSRGTCTKLRSISEDAVRVQSRGIIAKPRYRGLFEVQTVLANSWRYWFEGNREYFRGSFAGDN